MVEEAGILSDRIRRRGAPPWDYEDYIDEDPEFLDRYYETRRASYSGVEVSISQNPFLFTVRFADPLSGLISGLGGIVLKSQDGGRTWRYEGIGRKQALFSVQPLPTRAIVVGEKGLMRDLRRRRRQLARAAGLPHDLHLHARPRLRPRRPGRLHRGAAGDGAALRGQRPVVAADAASAEPDGGRRKGRVNGVRGFKPGGRAADATRGASDFARHPEVTPGDRP